MSAQTIHTVNSLEAIRRLPPDVAVLKGEDLGDSEVLAITSLHSLRDLDLSGCENVTDSAVSELHRMSTLQKIDLSFCNQITDASVIALAGLPALRFLNLNWCYSVTDAGLSRLGQCKSLEWLSLWSCEAVTDGGVEALAALPNLRVLELPEFATVTDRALVTLSSKAKSLESLRLDHLSGVSGEGIRHLGALKGLRNLTIQSCPNVTAEAVAALQNVLPECQISFKG
jgi:F-box/leucine-rich repeat protein 14